jgi:hypothetical protein
MMITRLIKLFLTKGAGGILLIPGRNLLPLPASLICELVRKIEKLILIVLSGNQEF